MTSDKPGELWILQNEEDGNIFKSEDRRLCSPVERTTNHEWDGQGTCDIFIHMVEYSALESKDREIAELERADYKLMREMGSVILERDNVKQLLREALETLEFYGQDWSETMELPPSPALPNGGLQRVWSYLRNQDAGDKARAMALKIKESLK